MNLWHKCCWSKVYERMKHVEALLPSHMVQKMTNTCYEPFKDTACLMRELNQINEVAYDLGDLGAGSMFAKPSNLARLQTDNNKIDKTLSH